MEAGKAVRVCESLLHYVSEWAHVHMRVRVYAGTPSYLRERESPFPLTVPAPQPKPNIEMVLGWVGATTLSIYNTYAHTQYAHTDTLIPTYLALHTRSEVATTTTPGMGCEAGCIFPRLVYCFFLLVTSVYGGGRISDKLHTYHLSHIYTTYYLPSYI